MRDLSRHTNELIERLHKPPTLSQRIQGSRFTETEILATIGESNEPLAIAGILSFVLADQVDVATAAASAIHKLLSGRTTKELISLETALRRDYSYAGHYANDWFKLAPEELLRLEAFGAACCSLLGIASFHWSGYVREAAIQRLNLIDTGAELPFLLLRLNDWVSSVRIAAEKGVRSRLRPESALAVVANLALVLRLKELRRVDQNITREILSFLERRECSAAMRELLKSEDRRIRRASYQLLLATPQEGSSQLVIDALNEDDTLIRLAAARRISADFTEETSENLRHLTLMKCDRFMPVRREAFRINLRRSEGEVKATLSEALLDSNRSIRSEARYHSRKLGSIDVAGFYREHLQSQVRSNLYAVIDGLGETGAPADAQLIVPYASHSVVKLRRAAIRAIGKLNTAAYIDLLLNALNDEAPRVSHQALRALIGNSGAVNPETAGELLRSGKYFHVRRNALLLIEKLNKWDSIYYLFNAITGEDKLIASQSRLAIRAWISRFNRSFVSPTSEQSARIKVAIAKCDGLLDDKMETQLLFVMKGFI